MPSVRIRLTRDAHVCQNGFLTVFDAADLWKIGVQGQEGKTGEKGQRAHSHSIVTGILVTVKDAVLLHFIRAVHIALVGNAPKYHYGEDLEGWTGD